MKILLVSSYLPYPLFSGGHVRLYNLIKQLSKRHEITLVCEKRDYQSEQDILELKIFCKDVITVTKRKQWSIQNIFKTGFSLYPFLMIGHINKGMKQKISLLLDKNNYDVIHVETFYVMQNLPATTLPTILVEHNVEYRVYQRYLQTSYFFLKPLFFLDIIKLKLWERKFWKQGTKLIAVSEEEKKLMEVSDIAVVPNGVDVRKFKIKNQKSKVDQEKRVLFIGDFRWIQNKDSATWILKEVWELIKLKTQNSKLKTKLWIVGRNIPQQIQNFASDDVIIQNNSSPSVTEILEKANVLLAPIRVGGGTSYKILEAMASGVAVVTTKLGAKAINAENNKEVLVGETPEELSEQVVKLLNDPKLFKSLTQKARKLIEEKYDWEKIVKVLENVYESAVKI